MSAEGQLKEVKNNVMIRCWMTKLAVTLNYYTSCNKLHFVFSTIYTSKNISRVMICTVLLEFGKAKVLVLFRSFPKPNFYPVWTLFKFLWIYVVNVRRIWPITINTIMNTDCKRYAAMFFLCFQVSKTFGLKWFCENFSQTKHNENT